MNVPQLRFKEFSGEWKETHLIKLAEGENLTNGVFNDPSKVGQGYKLINVLDMYIEGSINEYNLSLVDLDLKEFERNKVKNGDIFFTRSSLVKEGIAHSNVYLGYSEDVTFDGHLVRCSPNKELVTPIFFNFLLKTAKARKQLVARGKTATMTTIGQTDIAQILVDTPTLPEQTKIANFLTTIDERINQLTHKKELMTQYKQGVMQQIFSQQLRFKDDNGENFGDWEEKKLEEVSTIFMGSSPKSEFYNEDGNGLPLLQGNADIKNRKSAPRIFTSEITRECLPDDILLSVRAPVGSVAISNHYACIGRGIAAIRANSKISQIFIYQWLLNFEEKWKSFSQGSTFDSVNSDDIKNFKVTFPTLAEQTKIANFLTTLDEKIQHITQQIEATKQYKQGLLQQMFV